MKQYWRYNALEGFFCFLAASAVLINFVEGFYIPDWIRDGYYISFLVCAVTLLYCYFGAYNKWTRIIFSVCFVIIAVVFFLYMRGAGIDIVDTEGSPTAVYIYYICAPLIAGVTYFLTRTRIGIAVLFILGIGVNAVLTFLDFRVHAWCTVLFVAAVVADFLLLQYRHNAIHSSTIAPKFLRFSAMGAVVSLIAVGLALLCWFAIIRPLDPPTLDIKLLTRYLSYEVFEYTGVADIYNIPNEDLEDQATDETRLADQENEEEEEKEDENGTGQSDSEGDDSSTEDNTLTGSSEILTDPLSSVSNNRNLTRILLYLLILLVLLVLLIPLFRHLARRRRMNRIMRDKSPREQLIGLYRFYLTKFRILGCSRVRQQTEAEYATQFGPQLDRYLGGQLNVEDMTRQYLQARYGYVEPSGEICQEYADFYPRFLKLYRKNSGIPRYLFHYFKL